jgi:hypothetical protein
MKQIGPPRFKGVIGFFLGGISAAIVNGAAFVAIFPVESVPKQQALRLGMLMGVLQISFFVGGAVGWFGIKGGIRRLVKPVTLSFLIIAVLAAGNQALGNFILILAFAGIAVLVSGFVSVGASRYFLRM